VTFGIGDVWDNDSISNTMHNMTFRKSLGNQQNFVVLTVTK